MITTTLLSFLSPILLKGSLSVIDLHSSKFNTNLNNIDTTMRMDNAYKQSSTFCIFLSRDVFVL